MDISFRNINAEDFISFLSVIGFLFTLLSVSVVKLTYKKSRNEIRNLHSKLREVKIKLQDLSDKNYNLIQRVLDQKHKCKGEDCPDYFLHKDELNDILKKLSVWKRKISLYKKILKILDFIFVTISYLGNIDPIDPSNARGSK